MLPQTPPSLLLLLLLLLLCVPLPPPPLLVLLYCCTACAHLFRRAKALTSCLFQIRTAGLNCVEVSQLHVNISTMTAKGVEVAGAHQAHLA